MTYTRLYVLAPSGQAAIIELTRWSLDLTRDVYDDLPHPWDTGKVYMRGLPDVSGKGHGTCLHGANYLLEAVCATTPPLLLLYRSADEYAEGPAWLDLDMTGEKLDLRWQAAANWLIELPEQAEN